MLQQKICNILSRTYNIGESEAYNIWFKAVTNPSERVRDIINSIIHHDPEGLPVILGRNPTIAYGSILQGYCVGINDNFTMSISLQILKLIAGDFDKPLMYIRYFVYNNITHCQSESH